MTNKKPSPTKVGGGIKKRLDSKQTQPPPDPALFGRDLFGNPVTSVATLRKEHVMPPFSVLNARDREWQARKRAWLSLGIQSEVGRDKTMGSLATLSNLMGYESEDDLPSYWATSVFDPVLCECCYRWFCPPGGVVLDPFAGGSVRGIVAGSLGLQYWGCDLSARQVAENRAQADKIRPPSLPVWVEGDSAETLLSAPDADLVFSCPPYGDLEVYSDDPRDISAMGFVDFTRAYRMIIARAAARLREDRFAVFVVGDYRDKSGHFRNFVGGTVRAFKDAGLELYNEAILVTSVASAALRVRQFRVSRKLVKTHQNVLVFVKGSWKKAASACNGVA